MATNPIRGSPECEKRKHHRSLDGRRTQRLFAESGPRERTLVLLDVPTGMPRGEVLATQWCDIALRKEDAERGKVDLATAPGAGENSLCRDSGLSTAGTHR